MIEINESDFFATRVTNFGRESVAPGKIRLTRLGGCRRSSHHQCPPLIQAIPSMLPQFPQTIHVQR